MGDSDFQQPGNYMSCLGRYENYMGLSRVSIWCVTSEEGKKVC